MKIYWLLALIITAILIISVLTTLYLDYATAEPAYNVVKRTKSYEIREYPAMLTASVAVDAIQKNPSNRAFKILADYIFGNNESRKNIAMTKPVIVQTESETIGMTTPVIESKTNETYTMTFVLPSVYTIHTVPLPQDKRIELKEIPSQKVAVLTFGWYASPKRVAQKIEKLKTAVAQDNFTVVGQPVVARYNPPFAFPLLMRNEIWIPVK